MGVVVLSIRCGFCGEWEPVGQKLTTEPNLNPQIRQTLRICRICKDAIQEADETQGCVWCGSEAASFELWEIVGGPYGGSGVGRNIGAVCQACYDTALGRHPVEFNEELKQSVRERCGFECANCGMHQDEHEREFGQRLHVHHQDGDKHNNKKENLIALCARCHGGEGA